MVSQYRQTYHCAGDVSRPGDGLSVVSDKRVQSSRVQAEVVDFECGLGDAKKFKKVRASREAATFRVRADELHSNDNYSLVPGTA